MSTFERIIIAISLLSLPLVLIIFLGTVDSIPHSFEYLYLCILILIPLISFFILFIECVRWSYLNFKKGNRIKGLGMLILSILSLIFIFIMLMLVRGILGFPIPTLFPM